MKRILLALTVLAFIGFTSTYGQSELIIEENFQMWDGTEDFEPDTCGNGEVTEYKVTREMDIVTSTGLEQINVKMTMVAIAPECDSRRVYDGGGTLPEGVSTGWVQLKKLSGDFDYNNLVDWELSEDTIGEFIFGPIPQIDSIRVSHSATGSNRGFRIYTSFDGEDWDRPTEEEFWGGSDCQAGDVNTVIIDESDVYIKFTAGFKQSDSTSQFTRLHDLKVWGEPGVLEVGIERSESKNLKIRSLGDSKFKIADDIENVKVYNTVGRLIYRINDHSSIIDLSSFASGIYIIRARDMQGKEFAEKVYR